MELKQNTLEHLSSKLLVVKANKVEHGQFEAVLSTDSLDRHGEHVSIKGMAIPKDQVIKMYYNHETTGTSLPIGKWLKIWKTNDGKLMGLGEVDLEDDFAVKVYKKILKGYIDSISIGFYPEEFDGETTTWTKATLVEASVVAEPANTQAVITQKDLDFTPEEFTKSLKVKLKEVEEQVTVKRLNSKGAVEDILTEPKKWELMKPYYDVVYAFEEAYYDQDTPATDFSKLLNEAIGFLQQIADGTYTATKSKSSDVSGAGELTELKTAIEDLSSRQGAVEEALQAAIENPAKKNVEKVRFVLKKVDQSVEKANRILKVQLKETQNV